MSTPAAKVWRGLGVWRMPPGLESTPHMIFSFLSLSKISCERALPSTAASQILVSRKKVTALWRAANYFMKTSTPVPNPVRSAGRLRAATFRSLKICFRADVGNMDPTLWITYTYVSNDIYIYIRCCGLGVEIDYVEFRHCLVTCFLHLSPKRHLYNMYPTKC